MADPPPITTAKDVPPVPQALHSELPPNVSCVAAPKASVVAVAIPVAVPCLQSGTPVVAFATPVVRVAARSVSPAPALQRPAVSGTAPAAVAPLGASSEDGFVASPARPLFPSPPPWPESPSFGTRARRPAPEELAVRCHWYSMPSMVANTVTAHVVEPIVPELPPGLRTIPVEQLPEIFQGQVRFRKVSYGVVNAVLAQAHHLSQHFMRRPLPPPNRRLPTRPLHPQMPRGMVHDPCLKEQCGWAPMMLQARRMYAEQQYMQIGHLFDKSRVPLSPIVDLGEAEDVFEENERLKRIVEEAVLAVQEAEEARRKAEEQQKRLIEMKVLDETRTRVLGGAAGSSGRPPRPQRQCSANPMLINLSEVPSAFASDITEAPNLFRSHIIVEEKEEEVLCSARFQARCLAGHTLLPSTMDDGWVCDAMHDTVGCKSGITGYGQSAGMSRFGCQTCNYDLCERCFEARRESQYQEQEQLQLHSQHRSRLNSPALETDPPSSNLSSTIWDDEPCCCPSAHPLRRSLLDDGWLCDANQEPGGCKSGLTEYHQSSGLGRFHCDICDYDLCERCHFARSEAVVKATAASSSTSIGIGGYATPLPRGDASREGSAQGPVRRSPGKHVDSKSRLAPSEAPTVAGTSGTATPSEAHCPRCRMEFREAEVPSASREKLRHALGGDVVAACSELAELDRKLANTQADVASSEAERNRLQQELKELRVEGQQAALALVGTGMEAAELCRLQDLCGQQDAEIISLRAIDHSTTGSSQCGSHRSLVGSHSRSADVLTSPVGSFNCRPPNLDSLPGADIAAGGPVRRVLSEPATASTSDLMACSISGPSSGHVSGITSNVPSARASPLRGGAEASEVSESQLLCAKQAAEIQELRAQLGVLLTSKKPGGAQGSSAQAVSADAGVSMGLSALPRHALRASGPSVIEVPVEACPREVPVPVETLSWPVSGLASRPFSRNDNAGAASTSGANLYSGSHATLGLPPQVTGSAAVTMPSMQYPGLGIMHMGDLQQAPYTTDPISRSTPARWPSQSEFASGFASQVSQQRQGGGPSTVSLAMSPVSFLPRAKAAEELAAEAALTNPVQAEFMRALALKPEAFSWLHDEVALPLLQQSQVELAFQYFVLANDLHSQLHGVPSHASMYNAACCLSLAAKRSIGNPSGSRVAYPSGAMPNINTFCLTPPDAQYQGAVAEAFGTEAVDAWMPLSSAGACGADAPLSPMNPVKNAAAADARLDLAVEWLLAAVGSGYTGVEDMRSDPDLDALRRFRPAGFYAAEQMAVARRQAGFAGLRSIASATPLG